MIEISLLNKYYNKGKKNELHVINNTTLTLEDTGLVCILGESGSGKTTLMNTVSGLDDFHSGSIKVDDHVIRKYGSKVQEEVRNESFGYIFQNYYLLMDRTVEYNISLALSLYHLSGEEEQARIDYVLKAVDMERYKKRRVSQLSGGQQQRVAIARALAKTPKVIFADEPTGNLDEANTLKIMGILKKMSQNCLVVLVTHERSIAECFADRILWIRDGKIEKDEYTQGNSKYEMIQDQNIYLKEYEMTSGQTGDIVIEQYKKAERVSAAAPLKLQVIYENGTYYVHAPEGETVEFLSENKEKQVIDDYRPQMEQQQLDRLGENYELERLKAKGTSKLSGKEVFRLATQNLRALGKKQIFLAIALLVMSVMVVLTVQDMMTLYAIDEQSIVTADSHYIQVDVTKNDMISNAELKTEMANLLSVVRGQERFDIYPVPNVTLSYQYEGFWQLEDVKSSIQGFSILPLEYIEKEDLLYGELPDEVGEIAVDKWVLENFMESSSLMSNITTNLETFMEGTVVIKQHNYKIVGITDIGEPDVFVNSVEGLGWVSPNIMIASLEQIKKELPDEFGDVTLESNQILLDAQTASQLRSTQYADVIDFWGEIEYLEAYIEDYNSRLKAIEVEGLVNQHNWIGRDYTDEDVANEIARIEGRIEELGYEIEFMKEELDEEGRYQGVSYEEYLLIFTGESDLPLTYEVNDFSFAVAGILPEDYQSNLLVLNDADLEAFTDSIIASKSNFYVYSHDKEADIQALESLLTDEMKEKMTVKITDAKAEQLETAIAERDLKVDARMILTATIFVVSLVVLYFMMKASAVTRIGDLGVYRLLGITKGSIYRMFALETALFSCCTTLIGVVATTAVTKFLASIESLEMTIVFPWYAAVFTFLGLFVIHIITGVLPIVRLLRLPPAQLAAKYDI